MAAKCNITKYALERLTELQYGFACKTNNIPIIENYLEYLNCSNVSLTVCNHAANCDKDAPLIINCNFNIISISATLHPEGEEADVIFDLKVVNYVGGKLPFSYEWEYDEDDFDIIGENTDPQIKLKLKQNKVLEFLVSQIQVNITDADGCEDEKSCFITPEGMQCGSGYVSCSGPVGLEITYNHIPCSPPKTLIMTVSTDT